MRNKESCHDIAFDTVIDLLPDQDAVILSAPPSVYAQKVELGPNFKKFRFEAIRWIKRKARPEERFWYFETLKDGIWSYQRELDLIESRKTRKEREDEKKDQQEWEKEIQEWKRDPEGYFRRLCGT